MRWPDCRSERSGNLAAETEANGNFIRLEECLTDHSQREGKMSITKAEIANPDFNREALVNQILNNQSDREWVVEWLTTDPNIMVYYHCYYILMDATPGHPEKFIEYWDQFAGLMTHPNSYHRDIAFTLLANLIPADAEQRFDAIAPVYFKGIHDTKFMTGANCIASLGKIARSRIDQIEPIFNYLISHREKTHYTDKQEAYVHGEIAKVFDEILDGLNDINRRQAIEFITGSMQSKSPRTRKICREIAKRRNL